MRYLFLLNPTAGKRDCTAELAPAIQAAAQRAGIPPEKRKVVVTQYAGHARELAAEAAHTAQADGEPVRIWTAGGDGTFNEALAAYAGSAIAKSNPMKTGINATKLAIAAFIVPFIFAYNPQMLFENVTSVFQIIQIVITALLGIFAVAAGLEGYILRPMHWPLRVLAVIGGLTLLIPGTVSDLIGLVIVAGIIALQVMQNKKVAREAV